MRTLLTMLAGLMLALAAATMVEGQSPAEPSWSSDGGTLTLVAGRLYDVDLLPNDALCGGTAEVRDPRRAGIGQFTAVTSGSATHPAERERNGLVITPGWYQPPPPYVGNVPTARLSGIPLAPMRMAVQGERRCGRRHTLPSLTIVVTGSLPASFAPHSLHYGIPLIHHGHAHDPDPLIARLLARIDALELWIAEDQCRAKAGHFDAERTAAVGLRGQGAPVPFHPERCCVPPSAGLTSAAAWAICDPPPADPEDAG